ncbi:flagellin domain protein [Magnetococcus marinus MC-1]|uniref:Flagellin n=1 Tax=Magnetococcus marinus (strain ATCC BAA-1437 / JCM 17883 / MC-1) TaxID=156889 RepID=A0L3P9_MAGMM|nr:flagellin [Magnetococcus marinus]ABK42592.1 flagellin domain protein [Magnetococcus marinus MC-1]
MALSVNPNAFWLNAQQSVNGSALGIGKSTEQRTSSKRAHVAKQDQQVLAAAAMTAKVRERNQESHATNDGISVIQVAQEALYQTTSTLEKVRCLTQVLEDGGVAQQKEGVCEQIEVLLAEIDRIAAQTVFNQQTLISTGGWTGIVDLAPHQVICLTVGSATQRALGLDEMDLSERQGQKVEGVLKQVDNAMTSVADMRAQLGDMQVRFKEIIEQIAQVEAKNGGVRIRSAQVAREAALHVKGSIQIFSDRSIVAQANQQPLLAVNLMN